MELKIMQKTYDLALYIFTRHQQGETECFEQYSWTFRGWIFHSL